MQQIKSILAGYNGAGAGFGQGDAWGMRGRGRGFMGMPPMRGMPRMRGPRPFMHDPYMQAALLRRYIFYQLLQHNCFCRTNEAGTGLSFLGGLRFKSRTGQIGHSVANGLPCHCCNISLKVAVLPGRNDAEMGPASWLHLVCVVQRE